MAIDHTGSYITCDTEADVLSMAGRPGDVAYASDTKLRYMSNGTSWFPTDALRVLRGTTNVDLRTAAATKILSIPATAYRFVVLGAHIEIQTVTGTVVTQPALSVGSNSPNYNNLFTNSGLTGLLTAVGLVSTNSLSLAAAAPALNGSTDIYAKVNIGAIGPSAYTGRIDLLGYFEI